MRVTVIFRRESMQSVSFFPRTYNSAIYVMQYRMKGGDKSGDETRQPATRE
jgi:hypothetical protein